MKRHLSRGELIDLAEGTPARETASHLDACGHCRRQLDALVAAMSEAAGVDVPEPSPLFWDQLSARVREAVQAEPPPNTWRRWFPGRSAIQRRAGIVCALAGGVVLALLVIIARGGPPAANAGAGLASTATPTPPVAAAPESAAEVLSEVLPDDPTLALVSELTTGMDWNVALDAGLGGDLDAGGLTMDVSAERAVTHMTGDELRHLQRLLQDELGRPGA